MAGNRGTQEGNVEKGAMKKKWVEELTNLGRESVPEVRRIWSDIPSAQADEFTLTRSQDVAKTVSFLASEEAEFLTGQTIVCDGGMQCEFPPHPHWTLTDVVFARCEDA